MQTVTEKARPRRDIVHKERAAFQQSEELDEDVLEKIKDLVESVRYGVVQIVIQDGRVVQIDKTEKFRFV